MRNFFEAYPTTMKPGITLLRQYRLFVVFVGSSWLIGCQGSGSQNETLAIPTEAAVVAHGKELFQANCSACHNFRQEAIGPALAGVTTRVDTDWLYHFIHNAPAMIDGGDERATTLYGEYNQYMPPFTALDSSEGNGHHRLLAHAPGEAYRSGFYGDG